MLPPNNLGPDELGVSLNETRYQANPKEPQLVAIKRIFKYLKATPNLGLWYPKGLGFDLKEFWYFVEVDATNTITFTLSCFGKPLSFNLDDFSSITGLKYSKNYVSIPPKEIVRAGLATLGLVDEKNLDLSSTDLVNSSSLKVRYFSPI
nr:hypothetical protein [Tanacetum cinerariifolium]